MGQLPRAKFGLDREGKAVQERLQSPNLKILFYKLRLSAEFGQDKQIRMKFGMIHSLMAFIGCVRNGTGVQMLKVSKNAVLGGILLCMGDIVLYTDQGEILSHASYLGLSVGGGPILPVLQQLAMLTTVGSQFDGRSSNSFSVNWQSDSKIWA